MQLILGLLALVFLTGGYFADKTGEASEELGKSAIKTALVLGAILFALKKFEVIK